MTTSTATKSTRNRKPKSTSTVVTVESNPLQDETTMDINPLFDDTNSIIIDTITDDTPTSVVALQEAQLGAQLVKWLKTQDARVIPIMFNKQIDCSTATIRELITAFRATDSVYQEPINPVNVKRILTSWKTEGCFFTPISLSHHDDGLITVRGGRHRIAAILTWAFHAGINLDSEEVQNMTLPVHRSHYHVMEVVYDNQARNMTGAEVKSNHASADGIDVSSRESLSKAYVTKKRRLSDTVQLMAQSVECTLTTETRRKVAVSALKTVLAAIPDTKRYEEGMRSSTLAVSSLVDLLFANIHLVLDKATALGITNFALKSTTIGDMLAASALPSVLSHVAETEKQYLDLLTSRKNTRNGA